MKIRIRYSNHVDIEIPDGLTGDQVDAAIGEGWSKVQPVGADPYEYTIVDDVNGREYRLDYEAIDAGGDV